MTVATDSIPPATPLPLPAMPPSTLQPVSLSESLQTHGTDTVPSPSPPPRKTTVYSSLTASDCHTLEKILHDVRSPSPPSSPGISEVVEGLFNAATADGESSDPGDEDEVRLEEDQYDFGDEQEGGYQDEDGSMELSDVEVVQKVQGDGDTIEDVMNLPGKTALPAPTQDYSGLYVHGQPVSSERKEQELFRAAIEKKLKEERLEQERIQASVTEKDVYDDFRASDDMQVGYLDGAADPVFQALQDEIGMREVDDEAAASELETLESYGSGPSSSVPTKTFARRASEDTPWPSCSLIGFSDNSPAVVQTPGGKHIDFAPNSTIPDTPFTTTLNYFKQYKDKENSPSKRRRKAFSPEEIAQLAREAREDDEVNLEDLDKYREMDLAPMEPIMGSDSAGDLITFGTPAKAQCSQKFTVADAKLHQLFASVRTNCDLVEKLILEEAEGSDEENEDAVDTQIQEHREQIAPTSLSLPLVLEQHKISDPDIESTSVSDTENEKQQITQHPAFINAIEMLPVAMFWATAAPIAKYSNKAFHVLVEKLTRMKL